MINRVSVNVLLKTVIATLAMAVVVALSLSAWSAWGRVDTANRIAAVAEASSDLFTALHNLRVDRAATFRQMNSDMQTSTLPAQIREVRGNDLPALKAGVTALAAVDIPDRQSAIAGLGQAMTKLAALHQQTAAAFAMPKAARPQGLAKEFNDETTALMNLLDHISTELTKSVQLEDSYVDQLLELKQLAWVARNAAGDVSVIISNGLSGLPLPPDPMARYTANVAKVEAIWATLGDLASRLPVPPHFTATLAKAKADFFAPEFTELRTKTLKQLIAKEKPGIALKVWSPMTVAKLGSLLSVAEASLNTIKEYAADQHASALWRLWLELGLLAAAVGAMAGLMLMVSRRVTGPLRNIQQAMLQVAAGDFSVVLPGLDRKDEIGDVANAVERFKLLADEKARAEAEDAMQRQKTEAGRQAQLAQAEAAAQAKVAEERVRTAEEQTQAVKALGVGLRKLSDGDLTFRLSGAFPDAYQELKDDFNTTMGRLEETIKSLVASTREVSNASAEISSSTTDLSQRTEEQAASLEETSASLEEISATVKKNAENAQHANRSTNGTREVADRGGQVVAQAVDAMAKIEDSSRKISDIIGVIDEIARQTNLLALNAAVEAARAGEAGRGFAVVASEVRSLAQRSSQAAKDIKDLITNSNGQVKDGVDLVNRAGTALNEIVESIKTVAEIVSDIATASAEQATGIEQVNKALNQMDEVTQQNSALVEENAATAKTLEHQADAMNERVSFFRVDNAAEGGTTARPAGALERQPAPAGGARHGRAA